MKKQTAVNWLIGIVERYVEHLSEDDLENLHDLFDKARAMEANQIQSDFTQGEISEADYFDPENPEVSCAENYYNEVYKK